jgi:transposase
MDTCLYASDLNDAEWALLAPLIPRSHPAGRRVRSHDQQLAQVPVAHLGDGA